MRRIPLPSVTLEYDFTPCSFSPALFSTAMSFSCRLSDSSCFRSSERIAREARRGNHEGCCTAKEAEKYHARGNLHTHDDEYPTTSRGRTDYAESYTHNERRSVAAMTLTTTGLDPKRVSSWHVVNKVMWLLYWFYPYALESYFSKSPEELVKEEPPSFDLWGDEGRAHLYGEFLKHFEGNGQYRFDLTVQKFERYVRARFPKYTSPYSFLWEDPRWERACHLAFGNQALTRNNLKATTSGSGSNRRDLGRSSKFPFACSCEIDEGSGYGEEITQADEAFIIYYKMYINQWNDIFFPCLGPDTLDFKTIIWPHLPPPESPEDMSVSGVKVFLKMAHSFNLWNWPYGMPACRRRRFDKGKMTSSQKIEVARREMRTWCVMGLNIVMLQRMPDENERILTEKAAEVVRMALAEFFEEGDSNLIVELEYLQD